MNIRELCLRHPQPHQPRAQRPPRPRCRHGRSPPASPARCAPLTQQERFGDARPVPIWQQGQQMASQPAPPQPAPPGLCSSWGDAAPGAHRASPAHLPGAGAMQTLRWRPWTRAWPSLALQRPGPEHPASLGTTSPGSRAGRFGDTHPHVRARLPLHWGQRPRRISEDRPETFQVLALPSHKQQKSRVQTCLSKLRCLKIYHRTC